MTAVVKLQTTNQRIFNGLAEKNEGKKNGEKVQEE